MHENGVGTLSLLVLIIAALVAIISIPDVPGVHSQDVQRHKSSKKEVSSNNDERYVHRIKLNYDASINDALSSQINMHLGYHYQYLSMAYFFARTDQALYGFSKFFKRASDRELDNADFLMTYVNKRGGYFQLGPLSRPTFNPSLKNRAITMALRRMLKLETKMTTKLTKIHTQASKKDDYHLTHTLEDTLLSQRVDVLREIDEHTNRLKNFQPAEYDLGVFIVDKHIK